MIKNSNATPQTVDTYIQEFPPKVQHLLRTMRATIKKAAPEAEELISYKMPAYKYNGVLAYFAAFKNHIGFYPTPQGITAFEKELTLYKNAKGSVQFPLDQPLPIALIAKMVKFRMKENSAKNSRK